MADSARTRDFRVWLAEAEERRRRAERVAAAFGGYRRERPREAEEARMLRKLGVPEEWIGPVREE